MEPPHGGTDNAPRNQAPLFDTRSTRSSDCTVATAARVQDGIELRFGVAAARPHCPGSLGADLAHCLRLDLKAARQLEEALTRVLGASPPSP